MTRAVVSDFGGVLTAPIEALLAAFVESAGVTHDEFGRAMVAIIQEDGTHPLFALERGEITERAFLDRIDAALSAVAGRAIRTPPLAERGPSGVDPNHELFAYYRTLRERDVRMALCTNNVREWEPYWRAVLPIDEVFDTVVDSAFVGSRKPESRIYEVTLERVGLPAGDCAFVDDLQVNVDAAVSHGFHGILFQTTAQTIGELEAFLG